MLHCPPPPPKTKRFFYAEMFTSADKQRSRIGRWTMDNGNLYVRGSIDRVIARQFPSIG